MKDLHVQDGFDTLSSEEWRALLDPFLREIALRGTESILEVGCGAGAFLRELPPCTRLCGIDTSAGAIETAQRELQGEFLVAPAHALPFADRSIDCVVSWSVFHYFDSKEYAKQVLREMFRVARSRIFIGDVNDEERRRIAEKLRQLPKKNVELVHDRTPDHLFLPRGFFSEFAAETGLRCTFLEEDHALAYYANAPYRYSVLMKKP